MIELTFGCEHEFADWRRSGPLPEGCWTTEDWTIVNSNGIAADPKGKLYPFGGELNTRPTHAPEGQVEILAEFRALHPDARINYRSNLHVHVRVPGLRDDLAMLKRFAEYNSNYLREVLPLVDPLPELPIECRGLPESDGAYRRRRRNRVSHHTVLSPKRTAAMLAATTTREFFEAEVPLSKAGVRLWHAQPRAAVNLRQLLQTDTVEFRHFPGTLNDEELLAAVEWCADYAKLAMDDAMADAVAFFAIYYSNRRFPRFQPYVHWMEERYRRTVRDGSNSVDAIRANIDAILEEDRARLSAV